MIFRLAQVTRFSSNQNRQIPEVGSRTPDSRKVASAGHNQNHQRTRASSGLFGLLVCNGAPQGRRF